jgi:hypothetical protein
MADGVFQYGGMPVTGGVPPLVSKYSKTFFVDPVNGVDGNPGTSPKAAFASLYRAHSMMTSGNNDVCYFIGNGSSTGTARLSLANAVAGDPSLTTGTLIWSKSACHLIGVTAPGYNARARISTPTGTYLESTFNALPMVSVTGSGNYMSNISMFQQFSTGANGEICLQVTGSYNMFNNVTVQGMASAAAAQGAASRHLTISGGGENTFMNCQIGQDTVLRTTTNAGVEFLAGTARNRFLNCDFPIWTSSSGAFHMLGVLAGCAVAWQKFDNCNFINVLKEGSDVAMTAAGSFTTASPGGLVLLRNCALVGATKWGDTNFLANSYVDNVGGAATAGLSLNPS